MCNVVPGAFAGVKSGGEGANEKQLACQSFIHQKCAVSPGAPAPWQYQQACGRVGSLSKSQCKCIEGSLQDKVLNIALARGRG